MLHSSNRREQTKTKVCFFARLEAKRAASMCQAPYTPVRPSAPERGRERAKAVVAQDCVRGTRAKVPEGSLELPVDCIAAVLSKCSPRDICRLAVVSKAWSQASNTEEAWSRSLPLHCRESLSSHFPGVHRGATPRETARGLSKGVLSADGAFFLALDPLTGKLRLHVSAARALLERPSSEDGRLVWRRLGGVPGSVFEPCAILVTSRGMRIQWEIQTPFSLPQGTFSVSWRVGSQGGEGAPTDPTQRFSNLTSASACLQASLIPHSPHSPHSPHTPHSHARPQACETPTQPEVPSTSGAAVTSPEALVLDLNEVIGEVETEAKGAWDDDQARRAAAGWHAIVPCSVHSSRVSSNAGAATGAEVPEAPESQGVAQGRAGPSTTSFQSQFQSASLVPEALRRRLGTLWPFARCTCHEAVALQQQHLALLKQISQVETMQWEYLKLGTVQHKASAQPATKGCSDQVGAQTSQRKGRGENSGLQFSVLLEEHASNRGKSKLHVDGIVLTLL